MAEIPPPSSLPSASLSAAQARAASLERLSATEAARLSRAVMQRQFALSARVAGVFLLLIFALPLLNWRAPEFAATNIGGFPLNWLFLGVLFYPITWILSGYFVKASDAIEASIARDNAGAGTGTEAAR